MGRVQFHSNASKVELTLRQAQLETLQKVRDELDSRIKVRYSHWSKDKDYRVDMVGGSTIRIVVGAPGMFLEWGTGTRGDPKVASGEPYDIPRAKSWDWSAGKGSKPKFDWSLHEIQGYRVEYRSFRTKDGKVKTIPKKVPIKMERGRRMKADGTPKKALYIPGVGFRAAVYDHPGIFPKPIVRPTLAEMRDDFLPAIYDRVLRNVSRRYGVSRRALR